MANTFREFASAQNDDRKWVVFDGPIDTLWIESMNTVLDDNKKVHVYVVTRHAKLTMSVQITLLWIPFVLKVSTFCKLQSSLILH